MSFPGADGGAADLVAAGQCRREWIANGRVAQHPFDSSFGRSIRRCATGVARLRRNNVVHAQHWRHDDGPHPTLCVIHGFMGSAYLFNGLFFSLPWFYRSGYDVLLYTMPFHGRRAEKYSPFSGYGFFANRLRGFRRGDGAGRARLPFAVMDYLEFTGVDRIALTGMSLGGYTSALIASRRRPPPGGDPERAGRHTRSRCSTSGVPANMLLTLARRAGDLSRTERVVIGCGSSTHR